MNRGANYRPRPRRRGEISNVQKTQRTRRGLQHSQGWSRRPKGKIRGHGPGFLKGPKLTAMVRALRLRKLYISRYNSVQMKFDLYTAKGQVEETALIDSGATANFIDYRTVARLRLGTQKLQQTHSVRNIDGTFNRSGHISNCCNLLVSQAGKQVRARFFVTNLGNDR